MSILDWFDKKKKSEKVNERLNIPGHLWIKCPSCGEVSFKKDLEANYMVCPKCGYHFRITPGQRIKYIFDKNSFQEFDENLEPKDFLGFTDTESYEKRIKKAKEKSEKNEGIVIGSATLNSIPVNVGLMDFTYMGGSMGAIVGEKVTRIIERSVEDKKPLIICSWKIILSLCLH